MNRTKTVKYYRIKSRFRFTLFIAVMIAAIVSLTIFIFSMSPSAHAADNDMVDGVLANQISLVSGGSMSMPVYKYITVKSGDTLWDIAKELNDSGNLYDLVDEICKINNITANRIFDGQQLMVPVRSSGNAYNNSVNSSVA